MICALIIDPKFPWFIYLVLPQFLKLHDMHKTIDLIPLNIPGHNICTGVENTLETVVSWIETLDQHRTDTPWLVDIFADQDDSLVEAMLCALDIYLFMTRYTIKLFLKRNTSPKKLIHKINEYRYIVILFWVFISIIINFHMLFEKKNSFQSFKLCTSFYTLKDRAHNLDYGTINKWLTTLHHLSTKWY